MQWRHSSAVQINALFMPQLLFIGKLCVSMFTFGKAGVDDASDYSVGVVKTEMYSRDSTTRD